MCWGYGVACLSVRHPNIQSSVLERENRGNGHETLSTSHSLSRADPKPKQKGACLLAGRIGRLGGCKTRADPTYMMESRGVEATYCPCANEDDVHRPARSLVSQSIHRCKHTATSFGLSKMSLLQRLDWEGRSTRSSKINAGEQVGKGSRQIASTLPVRTCRVYGRSHVVGIRRRAPLTQPGGRREGGEWKMEGVG